MAEEPMFNPDNVGVGKGNPSGYAWVAPKGTTLPTDAKAALGEEFKGLGYVSEAGLVNSQESDSTDLKDWAGRVVKKSQNSFARPTRSNSWRARPTSCAWSTATPTSRTTAMAGCPSSTTATSPRSAFTSSRRW